MVMTMTERQEVAARLRAKYYERYSEGWLEVQDLNFQALNENEDLMSCLPDGDMFKVLADLIDPTCHAIEELEPDGIGAPHRYTIRCSNCGQLWGETGGILREPDYCPNCGARVVCDEA